jgi:hypothetical protein
MRPIRYIIAALVLLAASSCQKNFLNQVPDDELTIDQVFQRKDLSEQYLANIYHTIAYSCLNTTGNPWVGLSDESDITYNRPDNIAYASYQMNLGDWSAASDYYDNWTHYYQGIRSASYFMDHIGENKQILALPDGQSLIRQYSAEARFCRAYFYFYLLLQYGPVVILPDKPVAPDAASDDHDLSLPRSPYDSCVDYIARQLDLAGKDLPLSFGDQSDLDYGRATRAACMAVKSRLLLYAASPLYNGNKDYAGFKNADGTQLVSQQYDQNKWEKAARAAKDVIDLDIFALYKENDAQGNYSPYLSLRDIFLKLWNSEWIFTYQTASVINERGLTPRKASGYSSTGPTQQMVDAFEMANGQRPILGYQANGAPIINPDAGYSETGFSMFQAPDDPQPRSTFNMWVNREPRFYVAVSYAGRPWINTTSSLGTVIYQPWWTGESGGNGSWDYSRTGYLWRKDVSPSSNPKTGKYVKRPLVMYRYAEILLNYVEALNEYDPGNPDILKYLNMIRERAGVPQYGAGPDALPVPASQDAMRNAIHHERRVELCFEDRRYFDTRRWKIAGQTDGGPFYGMDTDADPPDFYSRWVFEKRVFHKNYYLFPIPQSEIDRDNNLVQNPGW